MTWTVSLSSLAWQDLRGIHRYVAHQLGEPDTAAKLYDRIIGAVYSLDFMPLRHPPYLEEPWHSQGLRYCLAGKYQIFFRPLESSHTVQVLRIVYGGRDLREQLTECIEP